MSEKELPEKRFLVDSMLGKVAKWLRVLGFNAHYEWLRRQEQVNAYRDKGFLVITRNRKWCGQSGVICLAANSPVEQLREVVSRVPIAPHEIRLLHRCILCNEQIRAFPRELAFGRVPDYVFETQISFYQCPKCKRVYWSGSHPKRMLNRLQEVLGWDIPATS